MTTPTQGLFNITPSFEGPGPSYTPTSSGMFQGLGETAKSQEFIKNLSNMFDWENEQKKQQADQFRQEFGQALPEVDKELYENMDPATQNFFMDLYMQGAQTTPGEQQPVTPTVPEFVSPWVQKY